MATSAEITLNTIAISSPKEIETKRSPGTTTIAARALAARATPANTTVRPAVATVLRAAVGVSAPACSSSRKRETINSA